MKLKDVEDKCKLGHLGRHEGMPGFFVWKYATKELYYENEGKLTRFKDLENVDKLYESDKYWYII